MTGSRECEAQSAAFEWRFEWVEIHHSGVVAGRETRPQWKLSVMIDDRTSISEPSETAVLCALHDT